MKKLLIIVAAIGLFAANVVAQKSSDIGAFVGTAYYNGDVNPTKIFYKPGIAYGGIYRYNPNKFLALRFTATVLKVSGNDLDFNNEFQQLRNYNFSENIYDLSVLVDFNFFQYNPAVA